MAEELRKTLKISQWQMSTAGGSDVEHDVLTVYVNLPPVINNYRRLLFQNSWQISLFVPWQRWYVVKIRDDVSY